MPKCTEVLCSCCQKKFNKQNKEIKKSKTGNHFCSRSCAATFNNKVNPKRQQQGKCQMCSCSIASTRKYCNDCLPKWYDSLKTGNRCIDCNVKCKGNRCRQCYLLFKTNSSPLPYNNCLKCGKPCNGKVHCLECHNQPKDMTISECIYEKHHKSSAYAKIRTRARAVAKKLGWTSCVKCGYDKHIEIAHKKPISEYSNDTLVSIVNDPSNLIPLCPNCHWEFDNLN